MNGASASAGPGAGAGAEGPLVYEAWKGSNVSGTPLLSLSLSPSPRFFGACVVWICAFFKWRLKLTVSSSLGTGTRLTCVVWWCSNSLVELGEIGWSLWSRKKIISQISHLFYDSVPQNVGSGTG